MLQRNDWKKKKQHYNTGVKSTIDRWRFLLGVHIMPKKTRHRLGHLMHRDLVANAIVDYSLSTETKNIAAQDQAKKQLSDLGVIIYTEE